MKLSITNPTAPKQFIDVMDKTVDICSLASLKNQNILFKMVTEELERSGNMKYKCPMKVGIQ
jgi:hypothetical protein